MKLSSPTFSSNGAIPSRYTCDGKNVNPPLHIADVPTEAKTLVLIVDDPDAPNGTWVHWTLWNIPTSTTSLAEHSVPPGSIEGITSFGNNGYGGPCPPSGTHHYHFHLYAIDTMLTLPTLTPKDALIAAVQGHILAEVDFIGLYQRK